MKFKTFLAFSETHSYEDFLRIARETGQDPEELIRQTLGRDRDQFGGNADFRRLPGLPYGLRTQRHGWDGAPTDAPLAPVADPFPGENFGQPVAASGRNQIVKLQAGKPAGFPSVYDKSSEQGVAKARDEFFERLQQAAEMPLDAYVKLMKQIQYINSRGYCVDPSKSGNMLVDPAGQSFNLVDLNKKNDQSPNNTAGEVAVMLMNNFWAAELVGNDPRAKEWLRAIMNNVKKAAQMAGLPMGGSSSLDYSHQLAGVKPDGAGGDWQSHEYGPVDLSRYVKKPKTQGPPAGWGSIDV
jgi:hypothetical protein